MPLNLTGKLVESFQNNVTSKEYLKNCILYLLLIHARR